MAEDMTKHIHLPSTVEIRQVEGFGRGVFATRTLPVGTEVLTAFPYVHSVSNTARGTVCDYCLSEPESKSLQRCGRCKFVYYCDSTCQLVHFDHLQRSDWSLHKGECKGLLKVSPGEPTSLMRMGLRALEKKRLLEANASWDIDLLCSVPVDFFSQPGADKLHETFFMTGMRQLCEGVNDDTASADTHEILRKLICNTFSIYNTDLTSIAAAIYTAPSFINHSCVPNCVVVYNGRELSLRTVWEIGEGEQLFISYIEQLQAYDGRKEELWKMYNFYCTCQRCRENDSLDHKLLMDAKGEECLTSLRSKVDKDFKKVEQLKKDNDWRAVTRNNQELYDKYIKVLDPRNVYIVRIIESLFLSSLELREWRKALECCVRLKPPYLLYYGEYHPVSVLLFVKTAKLRRCIGTTEQLQLSVQDLTKALGCSVITYGAGHPLTKEASEMLQDSKIELLTRTR